MVPVAKKGSSGKSPAPLRKSGSPQRCARVDFFTDPTEDRTWTFDATYLMSNHRCIFGEGCQGVLDADATDMMQGCCSYGAHFVDDDDVQTVVRAFINVEPRHMQFYETAVVKGFLDAGEPDSDGNPITTTRLVDDACIFLNRPGFEGGLAAPFTSRLSRRARPLDWKPNVCWQVPCDSSMQPTKPVTSCHNCEWKRRDWGEGGANFTGGAPKRKRRSQPHNRSTRRYG